jgi:ketosteroid isomerase-like protein
MQNAIAAVVDLETRRCAALAIRDPSALSALFTEDYVHCHANGAIQNKAEMLAYTAEHPRTVEPRNPNIRIFGDTAVITGEMINRVEKEGAEPTLSRLFVTQVASLIDGKWKFVSFQSTRAATE